MPYSTHNDCPDCGHKDCMTIWSDGNSFCHSCKAKKGTPKLEEEIKEVYDKHRSIPLETNKKYGITTIKSSEGDYRGRKYPYPQGPKYRFGLKDFSKNRGFKNNELFGMDKFNSGQNVICIVEGEEDAPSAHYMLGDSYPVVAVPGSNVNRELLQNCHDYLDSFKEIILIPDGDKAGQAMVDPFTTLFPSKVYEVKLTKHKDPNAFLEAGDINEFRLAVKNRKKCVPPFIYNTPDQFNDILENAKSLEYMETPIDRLNEKIKGLMRGHLTVITGHEGKGKTEVMRHLEYHLLKNHPDVNIAVCHLEESKDTNLRTLASYELGQNVRDPDTKVPLATIKTAIYNLTKNENLFIFDFPEDQDPLLILDRIRYFATAFGVEFFFIDPIQQLAYAHDGMLSEEQTLSKLSVKLEKLCTDLNIGIVLTTHVNDDGQVRSSRMIAKSASVRIDLDRNSNSEDEEEQNTTYIKVTKNRPVGRTGFAGKLIFEHETFSLKEVE